MKKVTFIDKITDTYNSLCKHFMDICKRQPSKKPCDIPDAVEVLNNLKEYENFIQKYFGLSYNPRTYRWDDETYIE